MELISSKEEIAANLAMFDSYRTSKSEEHRSYYGERLRLGVKFVYGVSDGRVLFAPSRFAGYRNCTLERHQAFPDKHGTATTREISKRLGKAEQNPKAELAYIALCNKVHAEPSGKNRMYWAIDLPGDLLAATVSGGELGFPDEVGKYVEGATKRVIVNAYERNSEARRACLDHYKYDCSVCGFNFRKEFGGKDFIHVHHLKPISAEGKQYTVDPIADLRPVCPNCHAMLHRSDPPFSIEELKEIRRNPKNR